MIGISKLYCGTVEPSDALRYGRHSARLPSHLLQFSADKQPVVVWNVTRRCNLKCVHCYAHAEDRSFANELTTAQGRELIDDLAGFGVPVLLFSGGEPLVRRDLPELAGYAVKKGMRAVISTNGTLITAALARTLKEIGLSYVGISLDGMQAINDRFRGVAGAYAAALEGIRNCQAAGIKVGLRFTVNKFNVDEIPAIFDLLEEMDIPRVCFYHLVYAGRGSKLVADDLSHAETRRAVDLIIDRTRLLHEKGKPKEVLTVDNHADGPYLYLRLLKEDPARAAEVSRAARDERGQQFGPRHRLRELGRRGLCRPVLAPPQLWQRHPPAVFRDLDRHLRTADETPEREEKPCHGPLRRLPLAGRLRRKFQGAGRGGQRRCVGP